jgi:molecular chaperone DnaK
MSDDEIEKAVKEAQEFEAQDKKRKEAIDTRNEADSFVFQTEKALTEVGDKVDASQKEAVEADLKALKDLLESTKDQELSDSQISDIKAAKEKLMASAQALFAKVYEQAQAAGQAGPDMGQAGPDMSGFAGQNASSDNADDNVVDGEYREV